MKKLPKLYKHEKLNLINHNRKAYCISEDESVKETIQETLDMIFNTMGHPYNERVFIKTIKKTYETYLVSRTKQNVLTLDNEIIPIEEILFIKKIDY